MPKNDKSRFEISSSLERQVWAEGESNDSADLKIEDGCYLIRYEPADPSDDVLFFEGSARVMRVMPDGKQFIAGDDASKAELKAGADLYCRLGCQCDPELRRKNPGIWAKYDPAQISKNELKIPIFPRKFYRYYLEITKIMENVPKGCVSISMSVHEFEQGTEWPNPGSRWVCLKKVKSQDYRDYFEGNILDHESGQIVGKLTMCKISDFLRRASIVIHRVKGVDHPPGCDVPESEDEAILQDIRPKGKGPKINKPERAWDSAFKEAGWEIDLKFNKPNLDSVREGLWTIGELQQALYGIRLQQIIENAQNIHGLNLKSQSKSIDGMTKDEIQSEHKRSIQQIIKLYVEDPAPDFAPLAALDKPTAGIEVPVFASLLEKMGPVELQGLVQNIIPDLSMLPDPLDTEWIYQLLCVPTIDGFDRGVMFDAYGADSENLPREGAAVAAEWKFGSDATKFRKDNLPNLDAHHRSDESSDQSFEQVKEVVEQIELKWGEALGDALQNVPAAYFRVGVHEVGHAMGLDHNFKDDGFMNTTDEIADNDLSDAKETLALNLQAAQLQDLPKNHKLREDARKVGILPGAVKAIRSFPKSIQRHFQADDLNWLRFGPDVSIRPGTSFHDFGPLSGETKPVSAEGLKLEAEPLLDAIPLGAPARIMVKITNTSSEPQIVPASLSLKSGVVSGSVVDSDSNERTFWPLKRAEDSDLCGVLPAYESRTYTMTLLRGAQKALFPKAGNHLVKVTAMWQRNGKNVCLESQTPVRVTAPVDDDHLAAALKVLSTPDTLLSVAIVGDHLNEGNKAVEAAVDNPLLRPHFAVIRAKLLLTGPHVVDPGAACDLIDNDTVMSFEEIVSITELLHTRYDPAKGLGRAQLPGAYSCLPGSAAGLTKLRNAVSCLEAKLSKLQTDNSIEACRTHSVRALLATLKNWAKPGPNNKGGNGPSGRRGGAPLRPGASVPSKI